MLSQEQLKELLKYNKKTGIFTWRVNIGSRARKGAIAGGKKGNDYVRITIEGKTYQAHRLSFLYVKGYLPEHDVDHKNRIKSDNKWKNLRHVSHQCNLRNCKVNKNNKSGVVGVGWYERDKRWRAQIMVNRKSINLGGFEHFEEAVKARWEAEVKYEFPNCNTTSTSYQFLNNNKNVDR